MYCQGCGSKDAVGYINIGPLKEPNALELAADGRAKTNLPLYAETEYQVMVGPFCPQCAVKQSKVMGKALFG